MVLFSASMSLRKQLNGILVSLLPTRPEDAIKGTELIRLIRLKLKGDYSDASLRYHFSVMSFDPASPLAKVEKGQGYYLRQRSLQSSGDPAFTAGPSKNLFTGEAAPSEEPETLALARHFESFAKAFAESRGLSAISLQTVHSSISHPFSRWKLPEMLWIDWDKGDQGTEGLTLDPEVLELKNSLAIPPYSMTGVRLRLAAQPDRLEEDLFQSMSGSLWSHRGELVYALAVDDESLLRRLRMFSRITGVGISTLGLSSRALGTLPDPSHYAQASEREVEALLNRCSFAKIASASLRQQLNWSVIAPILGDFPALEEVFSWLRKSVARGVVTPFSFGSQEKAPSCSEGSQP